MCWFALFGMLLCPALVVIRLFLGMAVANEVAQSESVAFKEAIDFLCQIRLLSTDLLTKTVLSVHTVHVSIFFILATLAFIFDCAPEPTEKQKIAVEKK